VPHNTNTIHAVVEVCLSMLNGPRPFRTVRNYLEGLQRDECWTDEELEEVSRLALAALNRLQRRKATGSPRHS